MLVYAKIFSGDIFSIFFQEKSTIDNVYSIIFDLLPNHLRPKHIFQLSLIKEQNENEEKENFIKSKEYIKGNIENIIITHGLENFKEHFSVNDKDLFYLFISPSPYDIYSVHMNYCGDGKEFCNNYSDVSNYQTYDLYKVSIIQKIKKLKSTERIVIYKKNIYVPTNAKYYIGKDISFFPHKNTTSKPGFFSWQEIINVKESKSLGIKDIFEDIKSHFSFIEFLEEEFSKKWKTYSEKIIEDWSEEEN